MKMSQVKMLSAVSVITAIIIGCATMESGPTSAEGIAAALAAYQAALKANDVDRIMTTFSDDWRNRQGLDKTGLRGSFEGWAVQGSLQDTLVGVGEIVVDGDNATATVTYDGPTGRTSYLYRMRKEADGEWRFVYDEQIN